MNHFQGLSFLRQALIIFILLAFTNCLHAQNLVLEGRVADTSSHPLEGVSILLHELGKTTVSDANGYFHFDRLKAGNYHLHFYLVGYQSAERSIQLRSGMPVVEVALQQALVELRSAVIEESMTKAVQKEQSQTMDVVESKDMFRQGNSSLVKILEKIPGISSISTGTGVSKPVIRGMGFNRVVVAENGIKQEGQQWGGDHGLEIDQFAVERVEVVKGPSSLLYGSDGLGGVIHIRPAALPARNKLEGAILSTYRSVNNLLGLSAMVSLNKNDHFLRFRVSTQDYGDYRTPADTFLYNSFRLPIVNQRLKNTAGNERNIHLMTGLRRKWGYTTLTFSRFGQHTGLFSGAHGIPRSYQLTDDGDARNIDLPAQKVEHLKLLSNTSLLLHHSWIEIDLGYQQNHRREYSFPHAHGKGPQPSGSLELEFLLRTFSGNVRYHYDQSATSRWVFGINAQQQENQSGGFNFLVPDYRYASMGAFAFLRRSISETFLLNAGVRYDYGTVATDRFIRPVYADPQTITGYQQLSPQLDRVFGNWSGSSGFSWFPAEKLNVKFNLGSSFRMPSPPELTANGIHHGTFRHEVGDSTLRSERGYQSDLALHYEGRTWFLTITPFFNYFSKFIFLDPTSEFSILPDAGLIYRFNQADALHFGTEFHGDLHLLRSLHLALTGQFVRGLNLESTYSLPFTPPAQLRLDMAYEWEKAGKYFRDLYAGFQLQATARQQLTARNEPETPGFMLLNLDAGTAIRVGEQTWKIAFTVQNVFNTKYFVHLNRYRMLNLPEPGRNFMISLFIPFEQQLKSKTTGAGFDPHHNH
jgi:iron complex outermembrane recepter protein